MSQPLDQVYQNPVMTRQQPSPRHSNGSFGPVFVVLAVIVVISAVACVLGRLFGKQGKRSKEGGAHKPHKAHKASKQTHGLGPSEWETRQKPSFDMRDGDIEFGFDKKNMGSGKGAKNGGGSKGKPIHYNGGSGGGGGGPRRPEVKFADNYV